MEAGTTGISHPGIQADEVRALQDTIYVIGGKWKLPIMNSIYNGNHRFREIQRSIPGITTRMLSRELKDMEQNGIIIRNADPDVPTNVRYESTGYCMTFGNIIIEMIKWGRAHRAKITGK